MRTPRARPVVLTAAEVARATGGQLVSGDPGQVFAGVSTDSRSIERGALFVALSGERFDGHAFLAQARARGAGGLLVSHADDSPLDRPVIVVADTLRALQALGRHVREGAGSVVVAITGSAGKTTTKELTAELLAARYRVYRSRGNLNNHIGLPLSLIELREGPDVAVVELGMNHAGEIRSLVTLARPEIRVWINVGDAHIGLLGSREAIADAKAEILEDAGPDTVVVANADDPLVMARVRRFTGRRVTFGAAPFADVRAADVIDRGFDGTSAQVRTPRGTLRLDVQLPGRAFLWNVLAAVAVAGEFDVPIAEIESRVGSLAPVARRGDSTLLANGTRLVDDSYNASPTAVIAALEALGRTAAEGRRIAVLGEMLELGAAAEELHERCGVAAAGVDLLVVVGGPDADGLARGAARAGLAHEKVHRFSGSVEAAEFLAGIVAGGDVVLVKGSRGTRTDVVADRLREVA